MINKSATLQSLWGHSAKSQLRREVERLSTFGVEVNKHCTYREEFAGGWGAPNDHLVKDEKIS